MIRQLSRAVSFGTVLLLTGSLAHAQLGGLSLQLGGTGYGTNYPSYGYNNYGNYNPGYGYSNNGYLNNGYSNNRSYNNRYYNNNLNRGYTYRSYRSPNYYVVPQRSYPVRRIFRW
jgi:hypothetical protein